ncbi:MAG: periplasmic heavy metal sensor [Verrucomicrobiota bacterium]|nr:periplasmic heavy metal sensor [Verrucomicrobiota bacterium]
MASVVIMPDGTDAEQAWLKREFALTPAQYEKIVQLHRAYRPDCADHCANYAAERVRLASLLKENTAWSPEIGEAVAAIARIRSECRQSMLHHAYEVAACMSPDEGRRYLDMIRAQILTEEPAGMMANSR